MQLSKGFDYAVRSLVFLAHLPEGGTADLRAISLSQGVPHSYLAKVMRSLVRRGLVVSTLGREGGYRLRRPPREITLLEVFTAMEGELALVECMEGKSCAFVGGCAQAEVWSRLRHAVETIFRETTLGDLLRDGRKDHPGADLAKKEKRYARSGA